MMRICALLLTLVIAPVFASAQETDRLDWLTGCWVTEDGGTREIWSASEGGYYFGHAVTYDDGEPVFFEQMRIDNRVPRVLNVYPAGNGPSQFPAVEVGDQLIRFMNDDHDFPQRIEYARNGKLLVAMTAEMDGSRAKYFVYERCRD